MKKAIILSSVASTCVLSYYTIQNGIDLFLGIALALSVASNVINIVYEVKYGKED
ncbi:MAG: hypothetical protein IIV45_05195 [Lachnospiraceae bacterium]|nr:hypothetical protein [Lachnospiraceae bacterium]